MYPIDIITCELMPVKPNRRSKSSYGFVSEASCQLQKVRKGYSCTIISTYRKIDSLAPATTALSLSPETGNRKDNNSDDTMITINENVRLTKNQHQALKIVCDIYPFWVWNIEQHNAIDILANGDCCFNHVIGLPKKNGQDQPFFDYENRYLMYLQQHKHIWIKKSNRSWYHRVHASTYGMAKNRPVTYDLSIY